MRVEILIQRPLANFSDYHIQLSLFGVEGVCVAKCNHHQLTVGVSFLNHLVEASLEHRVIEDVSFGCTILPGLMPDPVLLRDHNQIQLLKVAPYIGRLQGEDLLLLYHKLMQGAI